MRTLVTGATGRVGSRFVPRLLEQGEEVIVLVREAARGEPLRRRGAEVVAGDLRDADSGRRAVDGVDAVVHLAASFRGVPDEEAVAVNRTATVALARAAVDAGVGRLLSPMAAYPASKAAAEDALRELHRSDGLGLRVARLAFVYGEGDPHLGESLMWARRWPAHKRLHLVHHADVAQGLLRALRAGGVDGGTWNLADDAPVTAAELHQLNREPPTADPAGAPPDDDPWEGIVDTTRARAELGFRPIYPSVYTARDAGAL
jgi:nucleoside-diphosphate-sugar epimerase